MRNTFANEIKKLAEKDNRIVLLSGDIGNKMFNEYKNVAPNRFINCGIAEANMMSMAAGLALTGLKPFVYTITPFTTTRCLEQIKIGAAYHDADITIIGTGSGLSYAELGPTHHSLEDMGIINCIPNMRILAPCDSIELKCQLNEIISMKGPTYIRIGKKGEPNLLNQEDMSKVGYANILREGNDILLLGVGPILKEALDAAESLKNINGIDMCVVSLGGISPLDSNFLEEMKKKSFKQWITLEEHGINGGLATMINNWLIQSGSLKDFQVQNICTPNHFIHNLGNQAYLRKILKIDSDGIIERIRNKWQK